MAKPEFDPTKPYENVKSKPTFDPNKPFEFVDTSAQEPSLGQQVGQGLRSGLSGATFGLSEPVISGLMAVEQNTKKAAMEPGGLSDFVSKAVSPERLKKEYQIDVERRRSFQQENPILSGSAEMAGAIAPAALTGGTSTLAKGLSLLPETLQAGGSALSSSIKAIPYASKALASPSVIGSATRIGESALVSGAQAATAEAARRSSLEATGFIKPEDKLPSVGETAALGAKFGGALSSVPELAMQSARLGKFVARVFTGVRAKDIDYYLANQKAVQNAPSIEEIKTQVDDTILKLNDDVDNAKLSVDQAKSTLGETKDRLNDAIRNNKNISAQQKSDLRIALKEAEQNFNQSWREKSAQIKNARVPIQPDDVLDSVEHVKQQVSDLSAESYKILDDYKGTFDISDAYKQIGELQKGLKVDGTLLSKDSQTANATLQRWKDNLSSKGFVKGPTVKAIIQEIDSDLRLSGDRMAGEYSDKTYQALMGVRRLLDEKIKTEVPGYAEVMADTAAMNVLRGEMSKSFGRRESVVSKLSRIDNPNLRYEKDLLAQLGELSGKDFNSQIQDFVNIKAQGKTALSQEAAKQALPEYAQMQTAARAEGATRAPQFGQAQAQFVSEKGPEAQAFRQAQNILAKNELNLGTAKEAFSPYKKISPSQSEAFIKRLMSDNKNNIELRKLANNLNGLADEDFTTMIEALKTKQAFEKGFTQGSSNVNAWGALGSVVGFLSGGIETGLGGAGGGAFLGKIMDQHGPAMTRTVLDGMLKLKANPNMQDFEKTFYNIPPEIKDRLKTDFLRLTNIYGNSTAIDRRMNSLEQR